MKHENPYAQKIRELSEYALTDQDVFKNLGMWNEIFKNKLKFNPEKIILEIGCSNAAYLREVSKKNQKTAFIGLDWKYKVLFRGADKARQETVNNIFLLRGKAEELDKMFSKNEIDEIWIFYPDPWAKMSQIKNRLIAPRFFEMCKKFLKTNAKIYFKTDHPAYFQWVMALFGVKHSDIPQYNLNESSEKLGMKFKQIKLRQPARAESLIPYSKEVTENFRISKFSMDIWNEAYATGYIFNSETTLFEKGFLEQKLPIYFIEITRI